MKLTAKTLLSVLTLLVGYVAIANAVEITVSPVGNDGWSGLRAEPNTAGTDGPVRTAAGACRRLRDYRREHGLPEGGIAVVFEPGDYFLDEPLHLKAADSGEEGSPVVFRARTPGTVRLIGGREVAEWKPLADGPVADRLGPEARKHVQQADLRAQGIADFGKLTPRGFSRPTHNAALELFFQDRPMTLSRYPNEGWLKIKEVPAGQQGGKFTFEPDRPTQWKRTTDVWVHGFWTQDWADSYERVASIDPKTKTLTTEPPHGVYGYTPDHRFYFLNVLEELDRPGEYYLDRESGMLYFWPPAPIESSRPLVSLVESAVVLEGCRNVRVEGFTIECTRGTAVRIDGGEDSVVAGCTIRNIGNVGAAVSGKHNGVRSCDIYHCGDGGVHLSGGDTRTLTPAGNYADNNHIHHYNRWVLTYRPAVGVSGVGQRISHNLIHDGPHNAIQLGGNDHVIEYNDISNVCTESDDVGAFYTGRSWVQRGTVIRHNYFHHVHSAADQYRHGSRVVYLDDAASGFEITGNVFYKAGSLCAVNVGGGRDNLITNNIFIDCVNGVLIDARGIKWASSHISKGGGWRMYQKLDSVNHDEPPYSERYPALARILDESPAEPRGNVVIRNLAVRTNLLKMQDGHLDLVRFENNHTTDSDPGFVNAGADNFALQRGSTVFREIDGFEPIPFNRIGLRRDEYRRRMD